MQSDGLTLGLYAQSEPALKNCSFKVIFSGRFITKNNFSNILKMNMSKKIQITKYFHIFKAIYGILRIIQFKSLHENERSQIIKIL